MFAVPSTRLLALASVFALAVLGSACNEGGDPAAGPTSTSTPSPTQTQRQAEPVDGAAHVDLVDTSSGPVLRGGSGQEPDQGAVDAFVEDIVTWLDRHLGDLQAGGPGDLEAIAADGLLAGAEQTAMAPLTSDLADADNPVDAAEYHIQVGHQGSPQWARADVRVTVREGGTRRALFVFEATEDGPRLVAAGPSHDERPAGGSSGDGEGDS